MTFKIVIPTEQEKEEALKGMGFSNSRSIGNKGLGKLGEILFTRHFNLSLDDTPDYDIMINGITVDIKCHSVIKIPNKYFHVGVSDFQKGSICDFYYFILIHKSLSVAWFVGKIPKSLFFKKAFFIKAGDHFKGTLWKQDTWQLQIKHIIEYNGIIKT